MGIKSRNPLRCNDYKGFRLVAHRTVNPIIPVSLNGLRTALSTPSKETQVIAAEKTIML